MGIYLNPGDRKFKMARNSRIYVDKSGLIRYLNSVFDTESRFICVSRPRRFGKSMAANMISAYYDRTVDGEAAFQGLEIAGDAAFAMYCNQCDVLFINMQEFLSCSQTMKDMLDLLKQKILHDVLREYSHISYFDRTDMVWTMFL
jgi:hypothetical protein